MRQQLAKTDVQLQSRCGAQRLPNRFEQQSTNNGVHCFRNNSSKHLSRPSAKLLCRTVGTLLESNVWRLHSASINAICFFLICHGNSLLTVAITVCKLCFPKAESYVATTFRNQRSRRYRNISRIVAKQQFCTLANANVTLLAELVLRDNVSPTAALVFSAMFSNIRTAQILLGKSNASVTVASMRQSTVDRHSCRSALAADTSAVL